MGMVLLYRLGPASTEPTLQALPSSVSGPEVKTLPPLPCLLLHASMAIQGTHLTGLTPHL